MRSVLCLALLAFACTEFDDVPIGTCGNGVLEPGETCDTFAPDGQACGAPGEVGACQPICRGSARCPSGLACGADGICRAPGGRFGEPTTSGDFLGEVAFLRVADVDGDGLQDLLAFTGSGVSVRFGDPEGRFVDEFDFPVPIRRVPDVGDLDGDGRADAVVPLNGGVLVLLGRPDRRMVAAPVRRSTSSGDRILAQQTARLELFDPIRLSVVDGDPLKLRIETVDAVPAHSVETNLSLPVEDRPTVVASADVGAALWVAIARTGSDLVEMVRIRSPLEGPAGLEDQVIDRSVLQTATPVQSLADVESDPVPGRPGLFLGDCSGDGVPDLIATTAPRSEGPLAGLALQAFQGPDFAAVPWPEWKERLPCLAPDVSDTNPLRFPLAVGDVDGDGTADVLARQGLSSSLLQSLAAQPQLAPWTEGRLVDLNRDGRLDYVAISAEAEGVEFGLNAGGGRFNVSRVDTRAPVDRLAVGDFDGDLFADVVVNERIDLDEGGNLSQLLLLRGRIQGVPDTAESVAAYPFVRGLTSTRRGQQTPDAVDDLFVEFTGSDPLSTESAFLLGSTQGSLFSLIEPQPVEGGTPAQAVGARTGAFEGRTAKKDLLVVETVPRDSAQDPNADAGPTRLVVYFGEGNGVFAGDSSTEIPPSVCSDAIPNIPLASLAVTRVAAEDETDSLVLFATDRNCTTPTCTSTLYVVSPGGPGSEATCWTSDFETAQGNLPGEFVVTDANANGVQDLVLSLEQGSLARLEPEEDRLARRQTGLLVVWDFDLSGVRAGETGEQTEAAFSGTDDYELEIESAVPGDPDRPDEPGAGEPQVLRSAITLVQADADPTREAVAITDRGALLIELAPGNLSERPLELPVRIFDAPKIAAADFTGDGIDDLVIAQGNRFDVLPGLPAEAR